MVEQPSIHDRAVRAECAKDFAEIRGQIARLANDKNTQSKALDKLTGVVERATIQRQADHDETVRQLAGYNATVLSLTGKLGERMASVEGKATSAHHRLDDHYSQLKGQRRLLWGLLLLGLSTTAGALAALLGG